MSEKKDINTENSCTVKKPATAKANATKKPATTAKTPEKEEKSNTVELERLKSENDTLKNMCENLSANNEALKKAYESLGAKQKELAEKNADLEKQLLAYKKCRYSADEIMSFIKLADDEYLGAVIQREKNLAAERRGMEQRIEELEKDLAVYRKKTADVQRRETYGYMRILFNRIVEAAYKGGPKEIVERLCDINLASEICWVLENEKIPFNYSQIKAIRDIAGEKLFDEVKCMLVKSSCWETHGTQQVSTALYEVARKYYW